MKAFESVEMATAYWSLITHFFRVLELSQYTDSDLTAIINSQLVSFDTFCKSYFRPVYSKKKKDEITKWQRPKIPSASPLLLPCEIKLIKEFVFPAWSKLEIFKKSWVLLLQQQGYSKTVEQISYIYRTRWDIVRNISLVTTKRLQLIRKMIKDEKLTKVKVTSDSLLQLLRSRVDPGQEFLAELGIIAGKEHFAVLSSSYTARFLVRDLIDVVSAQIVDGYIADKVISPEKKEKNTPSNDFNLKYQSARKALIDISQRNRHLLVLKERCYVTTHKHIKLSIMREVVNVCQNMLKDYDDKLNKIDEGVIRFALADLNIGSPGELNSSIQIVREIVQSAKKMGLDNLKTKVNLSRDEEADFLSIEPRLREF